ncbi:glycosyltransferase family 39 protein [Candidatus Woesearchaeota archaeon]|nr:glycosyltransferase family 39 protein [Candidatus Woesearchaeota archaeon]
MRKLAFLLLLAGTMLRLVFHLLDRAIGWDASVYLGMAKAIASFGAQGLWEPLRPLVWPLLLVPFHWLHIPLIPAAHALQLLIGIGVVWLVWDIARASFGERAGIWALAFVALSPLLAFYEHQLLTEQPAVFFALLAVWLLQRSFFVGAGIAASLSFLTKFPMGLVLIAIVLALWSRKQWAQSVLFGAGWAIPVTLFLGLNWVLYQNPVAAVIAANDVIKTSGLWLYQEGLLFYARELVFENLFLVFAIPGLLVAWRRNRTVLVVGVFVFAYLVTLPHKEVRFLPLVLPFVCILAAAGWTQLRSSRFKKALTLITLLLVSVWSVQMLRAGTYDAVYENLPDGAQNAIFANVAKGERVITTDPRVTLFTDAHLELLYYPLFPDNLTLGIDVLEKGDTLYFNPCDVPCAPTASVCQQNLVAFERLLNMTWHREETIYRGECSYSRFTRS